VVKKDEKKVGFGMKKCKISFIILVIAIIGVMSGCGGSTSVGVGLSVSINEVTPSAFQIPKNGKMIISASISEDISDESYSWYCSGGSYALVDDNNPLVIEWTAAAEGDYYITLSVEGVKDKDHVFNEKDAHGSARIDIVVDNIFQVPGKFGTISSAVAIAQEGAIIKIAKGTYKEDLELPCGNITLQGADAATTIIRGEDIEDSEYRERAAAVIVSLYSDVVIDNISVEGGDDGILLKASTVVSNCRIRNNSRNGVHVDNYFGDVSNVTISNCKITGNGECAIFLSGNSYKLITNISNCVISSNFSDGIYSYLGELAVQFCTIFDNIGDGVYITNANNSTITNCIISDNSYGINSYNSEITTSNINFFNNYNGDADDDSLLNGIFSDPLFADADLHLQEGSPALVASDAGGEVGAYGK
jgi:hypothetical protein